MQSLNIKEWKLLGVTDYPNQTPPLAFWMANMSKYNTRPSDLWCACAIGAKLQNMGHHFPRGSILFSCEKSHFNKNIHLTVFISRDVMQSMSVCVNICLFINWSALYHSTRSAFIAMQIKSEIPKWWKSFCWAEEKIGRLMTFSADQ